ncbi:sulfite reductase subunit alpha [Tahibacter sp.]|uniref:sulfite reductase subunit alpha n=1 Tax=Tahibacter sp. TaxID=2056211 RepID=UPI0028C507B0|nr:sulfite reductase subunit alpha [Tahibacter sp.]
MRDKPRLISRSVIGNAAVLLALVVIAVVFAYWQRVPLAWTDPAPARLAGAAVVVVVFVAFCLALRWRRRVRAARLQVAEVAVADPVLVAYASQTGTAEDLARRTLRTLDDAGCAARLVAFDAIDAALLRATRRALFIVSTYGEGDPPDMAAGFARRLLAHKLALPQLRYGVLALGDSEYVNFCGFGRSVDTWLRQQGAQALFDRIDVDNAEPGALRHWQHQIGVLAGRTDEPDWTAPRYSRWQLAARRQLNPGSVGGACFLLSLQAPQGDTPDWSAGDVAEIGPRHGPEAVAAQLRRCGLDGERLLDGGESVAEFLARHQWPETAPAAGDAGNDWLASLKPLPHREYSIASIPQDGRLDLLVRQWRRDDGSLGLGSGWLTAHATVGATVDLRLRSNSQFHLPPQPCPLILIGNGTGIAGLRALLKARANRGQRRNWLLFGERQRDRDFFFAEDIEAWQRSGVLERVDLAFSRDQAERIYVQQRVGETAATLREWVAAGACIYVCGSLQGMAPAVDAELRAALGAQAVDTLAEQGRYRRDVY